MFIPFSDQFTFLGGQENGLKYTLRSRPTMALIPFLDQTLIFDTWTWSRPPSILTLRSPKTV